MITFCENNKFLDAQLDLNINQLNLIDDRFKKGFTDYKKKFLNLNYLSSISLIYENIDFQSREDQAEKDMETQRQKNKVRRTNNTILGAAVGAFVDSTNGDDSVLDGAFIGAAGAYALTRDDPIINTINLKENSEHYAALLFKNGDSVKVRVDASGMADLVRSLHKTKSLEDYSASKESPWVFIDLTPEEINIAENYCKENYEADKGIASYLLFALAVIVLLCYFIDTLLRGFDFESNQVGWLFVIGVLIPFYYYQSSKEKHTISAGLKNKEHLKGDYICAE